MNKPWPMIQLAEILSERQEIPLPDDIVSGRIKIVGKISFETGQIYIRPIGETRTGMILIRPGDLVVSGINAAKGAIAVYDPNNTEPIAATIHYAAYIPNYDRINISFLWWLLRSRFFRELLAEYLPGGIKTELKAKRLLQVPIPLPPLEEQKRIVVLLEEVAKKIKTARDLRGEVSEPDKLIGAYLNSLFGNPYEARTPYLKLERWASINEVVKDVADGPHITPDYVENGIPFITAQNITSGRVIFSNYKCITREAYCHFIKRAKAEKGDVLVTKDGTIGIPCFVDCEREFSFFVSVALIKPKHEILDGEFLTWIMRAPYLQERIKQRSRGDMIRHLVLREIRDLIIPILPLPDQRLIVAELDLLQARVNEVKKLREETTSELDALMPSILDRAFKGEL